jgi:hypothetical protein
VELLGDAYVGHKTDRMEFGGFWAVHFLLVCLLSFLLMGAKEGRWGYWEIEMRNNGG